jgi:hypothetical protein
MMSIEQGSRFHCFMRFEHAAYVCTEVHPSLSARSGNRLKGALSSFQPPPRNRFNLLENFADPARFKLTTSAFGDQAPRGDVLVGELPGEILGALSFAGADVGAIDAATVSQKPASAIMVLNGVEVVSVLII